MQEFLILLTLFLGLFFGFINRTSRVSGLYYIAAIMFFLLGIGILSTGWERYEGQFLTSEIDDQNMLIVPQATTYAATLEENSTIYTFGVVMLLFGLFFAFGGYKAGKVHQ